MSRKNPHDQTEADPETDGESRPPRRRPPLTRQLAVTSAKPGEVLAHRDRSVPARRADAQLPTPRARLALAARRRQQGDPADLQGLLLEHVLAADQHSRTLDGWLVQVLAMLFALPEKGKGAKKQAPDAAGVLKLIAGIDRSLDAAQSRLRQTTELVYRMGRPPRPTLQILAAGEQVQVNAIQQQDCRPVDLGERR